MVLFAKVNSAISILSPFIMPKEYNLFFKISSQFIAVIIAIIAIIMGQLAAYRKIKKLNLVDALKSNE